MEETKCKAYGAAKVAGGALKRKKRGREANMYRYRVVL
jgi:hypothetical protein